MLFDFTDSSLSAIAPMNDFNEDPHASQNTTCLIQAFQDQTVHTVTHLSATHIWISAFLCQPFQPQPSSSAQILHYCRQTQSFSWELSNPIAHLFESKDRDSSLLPPMQVVKLQEKTYICAYTANPIQYVLVKTDSCLSSIQEYCFKQYAQYIKQCIEAAQQQNHYNNRIQILEETVHRIDHQIRNPLELICLYADVLSQQCLADSHQNQIHEISRAAATIRQALGRIKSYCQSPNLKTELHQIDLLFAEVIEDLESTALNKSVRIQCQGDRAELAVDRWQLKEALTNLLSNAIYYSPAGETITCRWQVFRTEVFIEICDKGPGFSSEDLKNIFKPFYSRRSGGTGLGMTIARKIILDHQGSMWVTNMTEGGARLCIALPRHLQLKSP